MEQRAIELLRPLGQGGFGSVWLARLRGRDGFTRRVAVKLMKEAGASADIVARQRDEARLLGLLQHPNIVQVYDLTAHDGLPAVIMEFVEGVDLSTLMRHAGAMPVPAAIETASGVAAALHAGWTAPSPETNRPLRVIHRDIKPANVIVTVHGAVKVLDFGVARADFDREGQTQSMAFGTPRFMGPEQFLGGAVTPANDVFALGVTLWELVVGRAWERPPLSEPRFVEKAALALADAPPVLVPLLTRMLAWEPTDRPSAQEVLTALDALDVPGERLRQWALRVVPGVMATHAATMSNGVSGGSGGLSPSQPLVEDSAASLASPSPATEAPAAPPEPAANRTFVGPIAAAAALALVLGLTIVGTAGWWVFQDRGVSFLPPRHDAMIPGPVAAANPEPVPSAPAVDVADTPAEAAAPAPQAAPVVAPAPSPAVVSTRRTAHPSSDPAALVRELDRTAPAPAAAPAAAPAPAPSTTPAASAPPRPEPAPTRPAPAPATVATVVPAAPPAADPTTDPESARTRRIRVLADVIGAKVNIDGAAVGATPLPARTLSYGPHSIEVLVAGQLAHRAITIDGNTAEVLRYLSKENRWVWE